MSSPPLPYRPLEVRGHGVWDPARSAFYPFRVVRTASTTTLLNAKPGVCYFIHAVSISGYRSGDAAADVTSILFTIGGNQAGFSMYIGPSTASSGVSVNCVYVMNPDVLVDPGTSVSTQRYSDGCYFVVVYAEIPADEGERP